MSILELLSVQTLNVNKAIIIKIKQVDYMQNRVVKAIKEGLSVFVLLTIVAIALNFLKLDIGYSKFWTYLGNLEIIQFFDEKSLNGLIILGFLLGLIVFILALFFPDKDKTK